MQKQQKSGSTGDLMRYAGLGAQIFVSLGLAVFVGLKLDKWLHLRFPLLVCLLPFIVLCVMIYNLIKETSKKKKSNE
jgi:uncharacterized membrane protein YjgN (DUF898 family)